jgi:hypothetical protein
MGQLTVNPSGGELTPELAAKLRQVETEFERLEKSAKLRSKWFWLGLIPRVAQAACVVALLWHPIAAFLWITVRVNSTIAPTTPLWVDAVGFGLRVTGTLVSLLIATWAYRYTVARGEGLPGPSGR